MDKFQKLEEMFYKNSIEIKDELINLYKLYNEIVKEVIDCKDNMKKLESNIEIIKKLMGKQNVSKKHRTN
tara:strand:- start:1546 stop:1755 length:210 start_codon:yes stop_codon:yes gene_type:complete